MLWSRPPNGSEVGPKDGEEAWRGHDGDDPESGEGDALVTFVRSWLERGQGLSLESLYKVVGAHPVCEKPVEALGHQ